MQTITQNTTYLMFASVVQKILTFGYFIFVARIIGDINLGKYVFALSFTVIFSVFIDLGLNQVLIREVAKCKEKIIIYLSNIFIFKISASVICFLIMILIINLLNYPLETKILVYWAGGIMILDCLNSTFYAVWRGLQNLKYEAIGIIIYQGLAVLFGVAVLLLKLPLYTLILVLILGGLANFLFALITLRKKALIFPKVILFDKKIILLLLKITIPFSFAIIFSRILGYSDIILLSVLTNDRNVGIYSAAFKLTFALQFIPGIFAASLFPAFSKYFISSKEQLIYIFEKAVVYLCFIVLPISVSSIILGDKIILGIYGLEFIDSILVLKILMIGLFFIFLSYVIIPFLNGCNKEVVSTTILGIGMAISIVLNLIFIPIYGYIGAAWTATIVPIIMFCLFLFWINKIFSESIESILKRKELIQKILKSIFAAAIMGLFIFYLKSTVLWFVLIFLGLVFYAIILFLTRAITLNEIKLIWEKMGKR
ncbi:flippase [Candidatus Kuenenbacteria bacterium]|nr:flippase [Candidatus Kuenenbacteria bacterium]